MVCDFCEQEMLSKVSCKLEKVEIKGAKYDQQPFQPNDDELTHCHDCLTPANGLHHPGCDAERCPKCGGQLISCGCLDDEES